MDEINNYIQITHKKWFLRSYEIVTSRRRRKFSLFQMEDFNKFIYNLTKYTQTYIHYKHFRMNALKYFTVKEVLPKN